MCGGEGGRVWGSGFRVRASVTSTRARRERPVNTTVAAVWAFLMSEVPLYTARGWAAVNLKGNTVNQLHLKLAKARPGFQA